MDNSINLEHTCFCMHLKETNNYFVRINFYYNTVELLCNTLIYIPHIAYYDMCGTCRENSWNTPRTPRNSPRGGLA